MPESITIMFGTQTFSTTSSKVNLFAMDCNGTANRKFPSDTLTEISSNRWIAASTDGYEGYGAWSQGTLMSIDGVVLMIQVSVSIRGSAYANGAMLVALREDAPLYQIGVKLQPHRLAVYESLPAFVGRGDILTPDQFEDYNINLRQQFIANYFDEEELEEVFSVSQLAPGQPRPELVTVSKPDGSIAKIALKPEARRRIKIRK